VSDDPVRLDLADDVPAFAAEALRFARRDAPDAARLAAIEAGVVGRLGGGGGGGSGGGGGLSPMVKGGAAAMAAGAAVVAIVLATRTPPPRVVEERPVATANAPASAPPPALPGSAEPAAPTLSVNDLPAASDSAASAPRPANATTTAAPDPADSERAEVALLDRAQAALASRPADALASCDEHARRFPSGTLVQEREVLAIDALVRLGRRDEAEARAARFRQAFPRSGHLRRVDALLGR
jgi:hypothetical protein